MFSPVYRTDDEAALEIANQTVHGVLHLGWVPDGCGGYRGQMAVLVKPNGLLGQALHGGDRARSGTPSSTRRCCAPSATLWRATARQVDVPTTSAEFSTLPRIDYSRCLRRCDTHAHPDWTARNGPARCWRTLPRRRVRDYWPAGRRSG